MLLVFWVLASAHSKATKQLLIVPMDMSERPPGLVRPHHSPPDCVEFNRPTGVAPECTLISLAEWECSMCFGMTTSQTPRRIIKKQGQLLVEECSDGLFFCLGLGKAPAARLDSNSLKRLVPKLASDLYGLPKIHGQVLADHCVSCPEGLAIVDWRSDASSGFPTLTA